jgi:uncharacterized protein YdaT
VTRKNDYHVVPNSDRGGWDVRRERAERASDHHDRKSDAMDRARELAIKAGVERVEHNRKGKIVDSDSYGNDPNPPKDQQH